MPNIRERIVKFEAAYDKRHSDPEKNYGIHGVHIWFILKGEEGAVTFSVATNWMLPHVQKDMDTKPLDDSYPYLHHKPHPSGVDYHSLKPLHDFQKQPSMEKCCWLGDKPCYSDGSACYGEEIFRRLVVEGEEGLWDELEKYYKDTFLKEDTK